MSAPIPLLEVIALDAADAVNAREGGADRVELVSDMDSGGLSPSTETFAAVRAAVDMPIRVMLRQRGDYAVGSLEALRHTARELREAGADEFVLGFLEPDGSVDLASVEAVCEVIDDCPWTFHRAIDHAADRAAAWKAIETLPGLDFVLTSGGAMGHSAILAEAMRPRVRVLAGGGLREVHLPVLLAGGIDAFHTGTAVRRGGSWEAPVDPAAVRRWREAIMAPRSAHEAS